jgi:hypothetical protein
MLAIMLPVLLATQVTAQEVARNPLQQPFSNASIWNMPIGSDAEYVPAGLSATPGNDQWAPMPYVDSEHIVLTPSAPMTEVHHNEAGWSGGDRCDASGKLLTTVPMPADFVMPNKNTNACATFLMPDRRTIMQCQPLARCVAGGPATSLVKFAPVDLYGDGITGAHGGSNLSAIGGTLRVGELRPGSNEGPRHALKVNVYAKEALCECKTAEESFRWPARNGDGYAVGFYGVETKNENKAMKMGALLAIPNSQRLSELKLETEPARQLAWTFQNYGAYIVDDTYTPAFALNAEDGPAGSFAKQFESDYGYPLIQRVRDNSPWTRDMQKIIQALHVVDNNSASKIGGGGKPLQPLAPELAVPVVP